MAQTYRKYLIESEGAGSTGLVLYCLVASAEMTSVWKKVTVFIFADGGGTQDSAGAVSPSVFPGGQEKKGGGKLSQENYAQRRAGLRGTRVTYL